MTLEMAASLTRLSEPDLHSSRRPNEPLGARLLGALLALGAVGIFAFGHTTIRALAESNWHEALFWIALLFVVNLFPVSVGETTLTLDMPLLLALGLLYPAEFAALLAAIGAVDTRELRGHVSLSRAFFNRAQVALVVVIASSTFHSVTSSLEPWFPAILATVLATAVAYSANVALVALYTSLRQQVGFQAALRSLTVGRTVQFLATYLGYCVLALVLARLFRDVGEWSVVTFMVPLVAAQQALVRGQKLQRLTELLRSRERLLERMVDRIVDERRDERLRIAGDLHDEVLQDLTKIYMQGKRLSRTLTPSHRASPEAQELIRDSERTLDVLRKVIHDLQRSPLGRGGLLPTLQGLAHDLQLDWRVPIEVRSGEDMESRPEVDLVAYQVARESLMNALKHARATQVEVDLRRIGDEFVVTVSDDGTGFNVDSLASSVTFGLGLMKERVRLIGGSLKIASKPEGGTTVQARFPFTDQRHLLDDLAARGRAIPPAPTRAERK
jgi:signal transduction histidine kinase